MKSDAQGRVRIMGQVGGEKKYFDIPVDTSNGDANHPGIQSVWARFKLVDLSNRETYAPGETIKKEIIETSIRSNLISRYTAFLAVDSLEPAKDGPGYTVEIPVPVPDGVAYETTVGPGRYTP
jgi:Ca-activated chloride channel family protein